MHLRDGGLKAVQGTLYRSPGGGRDPADGTPDPGPLELFEGTRLERCVRDVYLNRPVGAGPKFLGAIEQVRPPVVGEPRVPKGQDAVEHMGPVPAHQDWRVRALSRFGIRPDGTERDILTVKARLVLRPYCLHGLDTLGQDLHPDRRVGAVVGHFLPVPARPDTELEPAAGQAVDAGTSLAVIIGSRWMTRQMLLPTRRRLVAVAAAVMATNRSYRCQYLRGRPSPFSAKGWGLAGI